VRSRELGVAIGTLEPGPNDAITDLAGVRVGHTTLIEGEGPLVTGRGPVRTGVTVVVPSATIRSEPLFAGSHRLNGNGELTGLEWIRESGMLTAPVAITNTHSVGVVRDALIAYDVRTRRTGDVRWSLPVVGETWDGLLNDVNGQHVKPEHLFAAMDTASSGPVAEGSVGGGTGMVCHEFKGGIGTASRRVPSGFTVGVLVQANYGVRSRLRVDGVPVGEALPTSDIPSPWEQQRHVYPPPGAGSIIVIVATDAPLLPNQCDRLAQRAGLGIGRMGGVGYHSSGDLFLCFSTGNRGALPDPEAERGEGPIATSVERLSDAHIDPLFDGVVEATEEAILNALLAADTMAGRDGIIADALPAERLVEIMARYGRGPAR
jgi:D-aminopeptidase